MKDDYLWDGTGEPDAEVQRLERLLAGLRYDRPAPEFSGIDVKPARSRLRILLPRFAAAAAVLMIVGGAWLIQRLNQPSWEVASLAGRPKVGSNHIGDSGGWESATGSRPTTLRAP